MIRGIRTPAASGACAVRRVAPAGHPALAAEEAASASAAAIASLAQQQGVLGDNVESQPGPAAM